MPTTATKLNEINMKSMLLDKNYKLTQGVHDPMWICYSLMTRLDFRELLSFNSHATVCQSITAVEMADVDGYLSLITEIKAITRTLTVTCGVAEPL